MGALLFFVPCVNLYCLAKNRKLVRERDNIDGGFGMDCLLSWFCSCCVLIQAKRQVFHEMGGDIERV